jgi:hypothetical protein
MSVWLVALSFLALALLSHVEKAMSASLEKSGGYMRKAVKHIVVASLSAMWAIGTSLTAGTLSLFI